MLRPRGRWVKFAGWTTIAPSSRTSQPARKEIGESIVTTGLDRIYPKGLLVGTVESIEADPRAPWHKIIVKPAAPVDRVEHVLVLLVEPKDLKFDEGK